MKIALGIILIILGIALGVYVGFVWAFIGGIVQIIESVRAPEIDAMVIAFGAAKIMFAAFLGTISCFLLVLPGSALLLKR